jgi:hypothetical protein
MEEQSRADIRLVVVGLFGMLVGAVASAVVTRQLLITKYDKILEAELEEARKHYSKLHKKDEFASPQAVVKGKLSEVTFGGESLKDAVMEVEMTEVDVVAEEMIVDLEYREDADLDKFKAFKKQVEDDGLSLGMGNIFVMKDFDYDSEAAKKSQGRPYIITVEDFMVNEDEYDQYTLYYHAGQIGENGYGTLSSADPRVDMDDYDVAQHIDFEHMHQFGYGSNDPNLVYVRCDELSVDFEIIFQAPDPEPVVEHSYKLRARDKRKPDKMRDHE